MSPIASTLLFGVLAALVCLVTLMGLRYAAGFTRSHSPLAAAFAAGLLLTLAIAHLIPEAVAGWAYAPVLIAAGFALGFVIQRGVKAGTGGGATAAALGPVIAIAIHAVLDGAIYAIVLSGETATGFGAAAGLLLHKPADAAICFVLLQRAGYSDRNAFVYALLAAGATSLFGAAAFAPFAGSLPAPLLAALLAFVAGILLNVALTHLAGYARQGGLARATPMVALGALAAMGMSAAHHHGHDHDDHRHDIAHHHHDHEAAEQARLRPDFSLIAPAHALDRTPPVRTANGDLQ